MLDELFTIQSAMPPLQAARLRLEKAQAAYDEWLASGGERLSRPSNTPECIELEAARAEVLRLEQTEAGRRLR